MVNKKIFIGFSKFAMAAIIAFSVSGVAHAATGDIINTTNKKIYKVTSSNDIKSLIADLKDGGNDIFLIEDSNAKYYNPNDKLVAQSVGVATILKAASVDFKNPVAIKTYIITHAVAATNAVKLATDKVVTQTVDTTSYTAPKLLVSSVGAINITKNVDDAYTLPTTVTATLSDGTTKNLAAIWYDEASTQVAGVYTFTGTLTMVDGVVNTNNITITAKLTVNSVINVDTNIRGNTSGNITNDGLAAEYNGWIYYANENDSGKLYKINATGGTSQKLSNNVTSSINVVGGWIYYLSSGELYKIRIDGTDDTNIGAGTIKFVNVINRNIYYCGQYLDVQSIGDVNTNQHVGGNSHYSDNYYGLIVTGDYVYFIDAQNLLNKASIIDGTVSPVGTNIKASYINVIDNWIYYINLDNKKIYKINTDGSNNTCLFSGFAEGLNVTADAWVYYINSDDRNIYRMNTSGTGIEQVSYNASSQINIAGGWLYYVNPVTKVEYRINLSSKSTEKVT
ncbi:MULTISPECIES: DUF5050 domain-containing protein [Clostridium]|uniref:DUF5050 domain-containing protein n=1 Tax=Clostridium frigoriphilum TaxID=443253 RepID=A0ABU7USE1_9CLOT|nr:DUF5050 domain-containing protein [Clostridium sp. DSM 17811]MBU3101574.1 DUF5050 domain-containing protein [Clostridium sp. DSM 17811]